MKSAATVPWVYWKSRLWSNKYRSHPVAPPFVHQLALCYLSGVCPVCLSVCGQTVGWVNIPLGTELDHGRDHTVLDGDPAPPRKGAQQPPHLSHHVCCGQTVAHLSSWWADVNAAKIQELIRGWDSERELLYDDSIHVEASAYAHWTDLLISTFYYKYLW